MYGILKALCNSRTCVRLGKLTMKLNFTVSSETPPTWRARFPYLYPPRTGWPSYTLGHVQRTFLQLQLQLIYDRQSVGQSVLVSKVKVTLRPTISSRPVRHGVRRPSGTRDQFFFLLEIFAGASILYVTQRRPNGKHRLLY
jgi:hypothetical protein